MQERDRGQNERVKCYHLYDVFKSVLKYPYLWKMMANEYFHMYAYLLYKKYLYVSNES